MKSCINFILTTNLRILTLVLVEGSDYLHALADLTYSREVAAVVNWIGLGNNSRSWRRVPYLCPETNPTLVIQPIACSLQWLSCFVTHGAFGRDVYCSPYPSVPNLRPSSLKCSFPHRLGCKEHSPVTFVRSQSIFLFINVYRQQTN